MTAGGLQAAGAIDVRDGRDLSPLFLADLKHLHHERNSVVLFEPSADVLVEHRGRKRPKRFPPFDLCVEDGLHIARRGSQRIERFPSARGPHSIRPWNQPRTAPSAIITAAHRQSSPSSWISSVTQPDRTISSRRSASSAPGPMSHCDRHANASPKRRW